MTETKTKAVEDDSWLADQRAVDQDTVEELAIQYPFAQWVNGKPTMEPLGNSDVRYTGGWFTKADQYEAEKLPGWTRGTLQHDNGSKTEGFFRRDLDVIMIHMRQRWEVGPREGRTYFPWDQYDSAVALGKAINTHPSGRTQLLCLVRGLESLGPIILTLSGNASKAITNPRGGVRADFNTCVIQPANALAHKAGIAGRWPYRAFWVSIGPARTGEGEEEVPFFTKARQTTDAAMITLPVALGLPHKPTDADIRARYVGESLLGQGNTLYDEAKLWARTWDTIEARPEPEGERIANGEYAYGEDGVSEEIPF